MRRFIIFEVVEGLGEFGGEGEEELEVEAGHGATHDGLVGGVEEVVDR